MKKLQIIIVLLIAIIANVSAQSIRKNYNEMTQSEKDALVSAFYQLRNGPDLINNLATFHNNNFSAIHHNGLTTDVFLAWHRRQIFEVEQAMQDINPNLSIPYWDWTTDNSVISPLWDQNFLGQFNFDWNLNRSLGSYILPTATDVANVQSITSWANYYTSVENGIVHVGAHGWVNGIMNSGVSPRDPVFYFHHGMVDKLWQEWVEANNITTASNIYIKTSLPRYDGTYVFNGQTLPLVNPDDIVDSKSLGVFFAENQLAELVDYSVSNTYRSEESFYYQYKIEAKNNFVIPNGKKSKIESKQQVVFLPGFVANKGSVLLAKIDTDDDISTTLRKQSVASTRNQKDFDNIDIKENAYRKGEELTAGLINVYPNPVVDLINVVFNEVCVDCEITVINAHGDIEFFIEKIRDRQDIKIDMSDFKPGVYFLKIKNSDNVTIKKITKL